MKMIFYLSISIILIIFISEALIISKAKESHFETPDIILVMGCGADTNQPLFRERILRGQQAKLDFPNAEVVISGTPSEVQKMSTFFENATLDISAKRTRDHFVFLKNKTENFQSQKILIATNDFHGSRSLALAHQFGFEAKLQITPSIYITSYTMQLREVFGRLRMTWDSLFE